MLRRVTLPLVARGPAPGAALVFLAVVTELTATLLLAPIGTHTLATGFWGNAESLAYGAAAPYALLMIIISAPAAYLLTLSKPGGGRRMSGPDDAGPQRAAQGVRRPHRARRRRTCASRPAR